MWNSIVICAHLKKIYFLIYEEALLNIAETGF
jgi:hypothetical protein